MFLKNKIKRILLLMTVQLMGINMGIAGAYCSGTCSYKTESGSWSTVVHGRGPTESDGAAEIHRICASNCETWRRNTDCQASEIGCAIRPGFNVFSIESNDQHYNDR